MVHKSKEQSAESSSSEEQNTDSTKKDTTDKGTKDAPADQDAPKGEEDQRFKDQQKRAEKAEKENSDLKAKIAELEGAGEGDEKTSQAATEDLDALAKEYDVDPKLVHAIANASSATAKKHAEEALKAELGKRDEATKAEKLEQAFDSAFSKATEDVDEVEIDKGAVKDLYFARKKSNPDLTVDDVITDLYGSVLGRGSSEDETRPDGEGGESIDFEEARKDPKKLDKILKDPAAKNKYFAWRDKQGI